MTRSTQSGPHSIETAVSLHDQAVAAQEGGDLAKAGELARKSLRILEEVLPPRHPDLANVRNRLASITLEQDNHVKAKSPHLLSVQATNRRWKHGDSYSLKDSLSSPPFSVRTSRVHYDDHRHNMDGERLGSPVLPSFHFERGQLLNGLRVEDPYLRTAW